MRAVSVATAFLSAALALTACTSPGLSDSSSPPPPAPPSLRADGDGVDAAANTTVGAARSGLVVTIGDSIMAGLGVDPDDAWPELLASSTGADIVNLGCSGAGFLAVGDCGTDFDGLVDEAVTFSPDLVIVQSSDNDLDAPEDEIADATSSAIDRLHEALPDAEIIGIGTLWHLDADEPDEITWSSTALQEAVEGVGGVFVSIGQPLRDHPQLLQWDGEHPNEQGQRVLSDAVARALDDAGVTL